MLKQSVPNIVTCLQVRDAALMFLVGNRPSKALRNAWQNIFCVYGYFVSLGIFQSSESSSVDEVTFWRKVVVVDKTSLSHTLKAMDKKKMECSPHEICSCHANAMQQVDRPRRLHFWWQRTLGRCSKGRWSTSPEQKEPSEQMFKCSLKCTMLLILAQQVNKKGLIS